MWRLYGCLTVFINYKCRFVKINLKWYRRDKYQKVYIIYAILKFVRYGRFILCMLYERRFIRIRIEKNLFVSTPLKDTVKFIKNFKFVGNQLKMSIYCYFTGFYFLLKKYILIYKLYILPQPNSTVNLPFLPASLLLIMMK